MGLFFKPLNPPLRDWRGKTVWLIGASSGIGEAAAAALHAAGARVVVSARRGDAPAQHAADPRCKLAHMHRLGDKIIAPGL